MDIVELVKADMEARAKVGAEKYGDRLTTGEPCHNGLSALQNAYEEALDLAIYLKKALMEELPKFEGGLGTRCPTHPRSSHPFYLCPVHLLLTHPC